MLHVCGRVSAYRAAERNSATSKDGLPSRAHACMRACVRLCVRSCVRACVRSRARARGRALVYACPADIALRSNAQLCVQCMRVGIRLKVGTATFEPV